MIKRKNLSESEKILKAICARQTLTAVLCAICAAFAVACAIMLGYTALKTQEAFETVKIRDIEETLTKVYETADLFDDIDYKKISSALERMENIDFESLNESIKILNEIIRPLGEFFGIKN